MQHPSRPEGALETSSTVASATSEGGSQLSSAPTIERSFEAMASPSLFNLPRKVRDIVLRELLTILKTFGPARDNWRSNFPGLVLLRVNRQLRAEAWDMIVDGNIWIELSTWPNASNGLAPDFTDLDEFRPSPAFGPHHLCKQPIVDLDWFPLHEAQRIRNAVTLDLQLGKGPDQDGLNPHQHAADSLVFALHPFAYRFLANHLAARVCVWKNLTVRLKAGIEIEQAEDDEIEKDWKVDEIKQGWIVDEIFSPLGAIRDARQVRIPNTNKLTEDNNSRATAITADMMRPFSSADSVMEVLQWFIDQGGARLRVENYGDAIRIFEQGVHA